MLPCAESSSAGAADENLDQSALSGASSSSDCKLAENTIMTSISRIVVLIASLCAAGAGLAQDVSSYPSRPVKLIVPFAAGGPADLMARLLAQKLNEHFGRPFYVENHPGAGGNIGIGMVAHSPSDGHTILIVTSSLVVNPSLYARVPYDVYNDLAPVTLAAVSSLVLVAPTSLPVASVKELVVHLKAKGNKDSIGSPGTGTTGHLAAETLKRALGLDLVHVPFNGAAPMLNAVLAGHVPLAMVASPSATSHIRQGKLRGLAVTSEKRSVMLPEIPTMAEAGVPGDQVSDVMLGVLVAGGTPRPTVDLLHRTIVKVITQSDVRQRLDALGFDTVANSPDEFAARIKTEVPKWAKVIRDAGIKPE